MTEEYKSCSSCKSKTKELSNEDLEKVSGGCRWAGLGYDSHLENGKYICTTWSNRFLTCLKNKTVDGINNVCTCPKRLNGACCRVYGNKSTCSKWDDIDRECMSMQ